MVWTVRIGSTHRRNRCCGSRGRLRATIGPYHILVIERIHMEDERGRFQYKSLPSIPADYRRVDWTFIEVRDRSFSEAEEAFRELKHELRESFADNAFAYLHFLRAVADRLVLLAVDTKQPVAKCLECLRRRLDLEYGRGDIPAKAAQAVLVANYAADLGETELARALLSAEKEDLEEIVGTCRSWLDTITQRSRELPDEQDGG